MSRARFNADSLDVFSAPAPPAACFTCGRLVVKGAIIPLSHKVCTECHGRYGKCGRCGFIQETAVARRKPYIDFVAGRQGRKVA